MANEESKEIPSDIILSRTSPDETKQIIQKLEASFGKDLGRVVINEGGPQVEIRFYESQGPTSPGIFTALQPHFAKSGYSQGARFGNKYSFWDPNTREGKAVSIVLISQPKHVLEEKLAKMRESRLPPYNPFKSR